MSDDLVVVGLGSSAGGLEALQILLGSLPEIHNCSYIIAQHLSPTHKSMMVDLLSRTTDIPVIEVQNGMRIKPKTIYMTPENTDIYVKGNKLYLKTIVQSFGPKPSVNYFLSSLAQSFGERSIGVILSGTGSDGAYGIRAVKAEGGITIAQSPATAKYDGMPLSAINTGKVDLVVPIEKLGEEIQSIITSIDKKLELSLDDRILQQVYRILFEEHGVDFSLYKKNTLIRRIERRLSALKIDSLKEYIEILEETENESTMLYHDILIGVTSFFRDKEAFDKLYAQIDHLIKKKEQGEEIRMWSIGCSTGEEAYSLAIILADILKEKINKYKIKIFATDIDDEALKIARTGVYSETSLEGLDKKIISKYFSVQKNQFEIKKSLRELVIFSKHNIVSDSPFLRLDLISCRNMLIYFSNSLQNKFFPIVHYALKDNGILFLGKSESVGQHIDLFNLIDKSAKIFKAQFTGVKEPPKLYNYSAPFKKNLYDSNKNVKVKNDEEFLEEMVAEALREVLLQRCVVINSSNDIIYIKGDIPFLKHKDGKVSNNIFKQLNDDLSLDLRSAINKASKEKKVHMTPFRSINIFEDIVRYVRVIVTPLEDEKSEDWLYVLFFQSEEAQNIKGHIIANGDENEAIEKLTLELDSTKAHLQNVIEELETSYEEMQSLNEELQSSNEELQSSNEELETTNEELQSTNEELQTAYSELRVLYEDKEKRAKQLEELTDKLSNKTEEYRKQKEITEAILDTAPIAITMVNKDGKLTYANEFAEKVFELPRKDILKREFNDQQWKITTFEGDAIEDDQLPFSLIKKNYESVHGYKHVIENDIKKSYLSVSGTPQFDFEGNFQGAVFCIEDLSDSFALQNDINNYQKMLKSNNNNMIGNKNTELNELCLFDISTQIRNVLSELVFELNCFSNDTLNIDNVQEVSNEAINKITSILENQTEYYTHKINYSVNSVTNSIEKFTSLFSPILENKNIILKTKLQTTIQKTLPVTIVYNTLYKVIEFIIYHLKDTDAKEYTIEISNDQKEDHLFINFKLFEFDQINNNANFNLEFKILQSQLKEEQIQASIDAVHGSIICQIE